MSKSTNLKKYKSCKRKKPLSDDWASASGWCIEFETPDDSGWTTTQIEITNCPMCGRKLGELDV